MIVAVEGGDANISLSSLDKLAAAIGVGFVDLVRDPARPPSAEINEVTWRGASAESTGNSLFNHFIGVDDFMSLDSLYTPA